MNDMLSRAREKLQTAARRFAEAGSDESSGELERAAVLFAYHLGHAAGSAVGRIFKAFASPSPSEKEGR